jgi:hypothetical protein
MVPSDKGNKQRQLLPVCIHCRTVKTREKNLKKNGKFSHRVERNYFRHIVSVVCRRGQFWRPQDSSPEASFQLNNGKDLGYIIISQGRDHSKRIISQGEGFRPKNYYPRQIILDKLLQRDLEGFFHFS